MMKKFKFDIDYLIYIVLFGIIGFLSFKVMQLNTTSKNHICKIEEIDKNETHKTIFYDQTIESLKQTNKLLYDSLKIYKDEVEYLLQFRYQKEYIFDTVYCDTTNHNIIKEEKVFEYSNAQNDTLNYTLTIGSIYEPNWYKLKLMVSDEFTIVNKKYDNLNVTTIDPTSSNVTISDVTAFHKEEKKSIIDNIHFGPSITAGYDIVGNNFEVIVGVSLTYDLPINKLWKH